MNSSVFYLSLVFPLLAAFLPEETQIKTIQQPLFTRTDTQYPIARIAVCWEQENIPSIRDRFLVSDWIFKSYEKDSRFHFVGWGICKENDIYSRAIRITSKDDRPYSLIGTTGAGTAGYMSLNFDYVIWNPECPQTRGRDSCITSVAAHEFGHALSALHEQTRKDTPKDCTDFLVNVHHSAYKDYAPDTSQYSKVASASPSWDFKSIMNYCNAEDFIYNGRDYAQEFDLHYNNQGYLSAADYTNWLSLYGQANKTLYDSTTGAGPAGETTNFSLWQAGSSFLKPDLFAISWKNTGSNRVEVHHMTGQSNYQTFANHVATPIYTSNDQSVYFSFQMGDFDKDGKPDLYYFMRIPSTGRLEIHILSGASNYQTHILHVATPIYDGPLYKVTLGNYGSDGRPDVFVVDPTNGNRARVSVLSAASNYQTVVSDTYTDLPRYLVDECSFITGNFSNRVGFPFRDLVCMRMEKKSSTEISMQVLPVQDSYRSVSRGISTNIRNENGLTSFFGTWVFGATNSSNGGNMPGDGLAIGFVKGTGASTAEVHFLDARLFF